MTKLLHFANFINRGCFNLQERDKEQQGKRKYYNKRNESKCMRALQSKTIFCMELTKYVDEVAIKSQFPTFIF